MTAETEYGVSRAFIVEGIKAGNSNIRIPIFVSFMATELLNVPATEAGHLSRALKSWPTVDLADERDGSLFTVMVHRKKMGGYFEFQ